MTSVPIDQANRYIFYLLNTDDIKYVNETLRLCMYVCVKGYAGQIARDVPFRAIQLPSYELAKKWYSSLVAFRQLRCILCICMYVCTVCTYLVYDIFEQYV